MKRRYERPSAYIEEFTPNEYVAACGDHGTVYNFECNAGNKNKSYNVYYYEGKNKKYIAKEGKWNGWGWSQEAQFTGYHPCKKTHKAESGTGFIKGYIDDQATREDEAIPVYIWTENGTNVHCTTNLDMKNWETAKS